MELFDILQAEWDAFHARIEEYEKLPDEKFYAKCREEVRAYEAKVLEITGDPIHDNFWRKLDSEDKMDTVDGYLSNRDYALDKMFMRHCTDAEVRRLEVLDARLHELENDLFSRTQKMYDYILAMPKDEKDDDIDIDGTLRYWGDTAQDVLHLEDDDFYGSKFLEIILIKAYVLKEHCGGLAIIETGGNWHRHHKSENAREPDYDRFERWFDDGTSWAESYLVHPKLSHIVMSYSTHALVTHDGWCIPDFLRLNTFEVKVNVALQQFSEQDDSRLWWYTDCTREQFIKKFLNEAEHRPEGMPKGEFIYRRGLEYFDVKESDDSIANLRKPMEDDRHIEDFLTALWKQEAKARVS